MDEVLAVLERFGAPREVRGVSVVDDLVEVSERRGVGTRGGGACVERGGAKEGRGPRLATMLPSIGESVDSSWSLKSVMALLRVLQVDLAVVREVDESVRPRAIGLSADDVDVVPRSQSIESLRTDDALGD